MAKTRRWARHQARIGALGHRCACWGAGPCSGRWGVRQSAGACGRALQAGGRAGERQARGARRRAAGARGAAAGAGSRGARGSGLALGSALGALGPFSIRFDSFFFPESPNEHRSL